MGEVGLRFGDKLVLDNSNEIAKNAHLVLS